MRASLALLWDEIIVEADTRFGFGFLRVGLPPDLSAPPRSSGGWVGPELPTCSTPAAWCGGASEMGLATH